MVFVKQFGTGGHYSAFLRVVTMKFMNNPSGLIKKASVLKFFRVERV